MAKIIDKEKAIKLRLLGNSYSQIKNELGISKSTLSGWLKSYPLSKEKLRELRDLNPKRIENYRKTMARKRSDRLDCVYRVVKKDILKLSKREVFLMGFFLYWGEGSKTERSMVSLSNTDSEMIKYFLLWTDLLGVPKNKINFNLQIYSDMNKDKEISFWLNELCLPRSALKSVRVKESKLSGLTYKKGFNHGTCNIRVYSTSLKEYILMGLKHIKTVTLRV